MGTRTRAKSSPVVLENIVDTGTEGTRVASGTTGQRGSTTGQFRFNSTTGLAEYYDGTAFKSIDAPPAVTSVNNTNITTAQIDADFDIVITGTSFSIGATVTFIGDDGTAYASPSSTRNSSTQITARIPTTVTNANEPFGVKVTNSSGLSNTLGSAFNIDGAPAWTTAAGTLGTFLEATSSSATVAATDPEGATVTYALQSGSLPSGMSLNTSTGVISGTTPTVSGDTVSTFTIRATAGGQTADRQFTITVRDPLISTFSYTGSGQTFTAPAGLTSFIVYMWGAGGAGGSTQNDVSGNGGNGGAGAYVTSTISNFTDQQAFGILVGQSNESDDTTVVRSFGGGGNGGAKVAQRIGGAGGGRSEINIGSVANTPAGTRILVAGGGGGGNARYSNTESIVHANATGGTTGADGNEPSGQTGAPPTGGTPSAGGTAGSGQQQAGRPASEKAIDGVAGIGGYATGGNVSTDTSYGAGGGGGGGYYGGGGGDGGLTPGGSGNSAHSGAGGSSYANATYCASTTHGTGSGQTAPETGNTYYGSGAAAGGPGIGVIGSSGTAGGHGRVVIIY